MKNEALLAVTGSKENKKMQKTLFVVDVESDGPCPGLYSMISFGAVAVDRSLSKTFLGKVAPLPGASRFEAAAAISGTSRAMHESYEDPEVVMTKFRDWIKEVSQDSVPIFVNDNPAFDWQFINYYLLLSSFSRK